MPYISFRAGGVHAMALPGDQRIVALWFPAIFGGRIVTLWFPASFGGRIVTL